MPAGYPISSAGPRFLSLTAIPMMSDGGNGSAVLTRVLSSGGMPVPRLVRSSLLVGGILLLGGLCWLVALRKSDLSREALSRINREARRELAAGSPEAALAVLQPALRPEVNDARIWEGAGAAYLSLRRGPEAVEAYDRIPPESEEWESSRLGLARAILLQGNWDRALGILEEATARHPADLPALEELRWLQFNLVRPRHAAETLTRKLVAGDLGALPDLLETAHRPPVPQESLRVLADVDIKFPAQPAVKLALGRCRWYLGELPAARELMMEALRLRPEDPLTRLTIAEFLLEEGEADEAERLLSPMAESAIPGDRNVSPLITLDKERYWSLRSQVLERHGDLEGSLAALEKGESFGSPRVEWLTRRASLLRVLRRTDEAREVARLAEASAAAERELGELVDSGKHRNPGVAEARSIAAACRVLKRDAEVEGWQVIAARLAGPPPGRRP